jgi:hypothetical protein
VCELCKNGRPGVHSPYCRFFVPGHSFLRCDGCNGAVVPSNPTYWARLRYCTACLTKRGQDRQSPPRPVAGTRSGKTDTEVQQPVSAAGAIGVLNALRRVQEDLL